MSVMAETTHAAATDPAIGTLLTSLEKPDAWSALTADQCVVVREARRNFDRLTRLPAAFVREQALEASRSYHAWVAARENDDFRAFAPHLEKQIDLARREAAHVGQGDAPYNYMIDKHDPGMTAQVIGRLFDELKAGLVPFAKSVLDSGVRPPMGLLRGFPADRQKQLLEEVARCLGFDFSRGRIDISPHPFCGGNGEDTRMTTRFDEDNPLQSLFGAIHETGHGLYEQGLPAEDAGTALGTAAGMAVHESQSRLWENQVGRGRPFWRHLEPRFRELFSKQTASISSDELFLAINAVGRTPVRVEADEVTYNLHIILRFEIEQRLFSGELAVADLPGAWREAMQNLLGIVPADDREGALQDVHWSGGAFGYFPSYCLGNMLAAQLWYRALDFLPGLEGDLENGDCSLLLGWLREQVHAKGRRLNLLELTQEVTGKPLGPEALLRYLKERYGPLYNLE